MALIFGFDVGTTSIGFAVISYEPATRVGEIKWLGVRIFPEARDPDRTPLNQQRRAKRMTRRQLRRRKERRRLLNEMFCRAGLLPPFSKDKGSDWAAVMKTNPYVLRERGLKEKLSLHELGRALYHLAKRRHFKGRDLEEEASEAEAPDEKEAKSNRDSTLAALKRENATLGAYLANKKADATKGNPPWERRRNVHATRAVVNDEFEKLWQKQESYYPQLRDTSFKREIGYRPHTPCTGLRWRMIRKTVEFSTPGTRLSVAHKQLVIERPDHPKTTLPIEDLGVIIVDDVRASYTQAVFIECLAAGATVMVTGRDHLPVGLMLPLDAHHVQTERHRAQVEAGEPRKKRIWQALVRTKIVQQGMVLKYFTGEHGGLTPMSRRVRSGDPDNLEAQAAQRYWPLLFGKAFRRDRTAEGVNALLNYGYMVVRAATARAIVAAGLIPSLGVFHRNRANPFALADDLLEPYRPYVDWRVRSIVSGQQGAAVPSLDERNVRAALLSLFNETIRIGERRMPLLLALHASAASLCRALTSEELVLALPDGLPLAGDLFDGEGAG